MSCSNPNRMFRIGVKDNGKNDLLFANRHCTHLEYFNGSWHRCYSGYTSPKAERICREYVDVPCGSCLGCKLDYSRQWANRCLMEMLYHDSNLFVTLTYDEEHLPKQFCHINDKAVIVNTLDKKDLQDFLKRLRKYYESQESQPKIRYFACGEYGSKTYRPHYHLIIFGARLNDLKLHTESQTGKTFTSDTLARIWNKGNVLVAEANYNTAAYTARYVVKKAGCENDDYCRKYGIVPEFITMSRKPGIGAWYYDNHNVFAHDHIVIGTDKGSKKFKPPRYFEKLLEKSNPEQLKEYKEKNSLFAKLSSKNVTYVTDMDMDEIYASQEENLRKRTKSLERSKL